MSERTKGWATTAFILIGIAIGLYAIAVFAGVVTAFSLALSELGAPLFAVLIIPGLGAVGIVILLAKVFVDRLGNTEDDYYSKNVER